ncbi:anthranilate phosphoribosyltransferase [Mangrovimonas sp. AS39]|uniref:anthranilate phosphoribosyltransferase n=1 Tax=Mangrovimonas futianensis TaxID=2895523 RepID=UPI001E597CDD|nr:anthranilate phosphoribosyltransferase [Mangrovimonas futianensis]MCF1191450.1 anthranilate phosphoribosyltransferase [Mangrovimonas futianensis]MCF1195145.1 anthranilate phosphoribosyltransferase [Mangrovimonas futianensis]
MKNILNRLINQESISTEEARQVLVNISKGDYNQSQIASFLTVYMMRTITVEELQGFRDALLELCIPVDLEGYNTIDLCGTGGDGKNTFNISTLASFVTAGAGIPVTKHGNYGVSSVSGSSNVMEYFGIKFSSDIDFLKTCLDKANICVLHAPLFHPAMKHVAPIRRELGVKTFFNMLGPMVNPAFPKNQLVGVFSLELLRLYSYLYENSDKNYCIVHAMDGYDEISLTSDAKIVKNQEELILTPEHFYSPRYDQSTIHGGETIESSAKIFEHIIMGQGTEAQNNVVCANAALAISTAKGCSIQDGFGEAVDSLLSGAAREQFETLIELSK